MNPQQIGKILIISGIAIAVIGAAVMLLGKIGLFRLPGDIELQGKNWKIYFPLASSIIISIVLTLLLWVINYFRR